MEHLAPFTKEVKVLNFGAKNDAGLRKIMREFPDEDDEEGLEMKMEVLESIAKSKVHKSEAAKGDFITMALCARNNSTLTGFIVGQNGILVRTDALKKVLTDDVADRIIIPKQLVPREANPLELFKQLFSHTNMNAPIVVCLPDDSSIVQPFSQFGVDHDFKLPPNHTYVLTAFDSFAEYDVITNLHNKEVDAIINGSDVFYTISIVPDDVLAKGLECSWTEIGLGHDLIAISADGQTWMEAEVDDVQYSEHYAQQLADYEDRYWH